MKSFKFSKFFGYRWDWRSFWFVFFWTNKKKKKLAKFKPISCKIFRTGILHAILEFLDKNKANECFENMNGKTYDGNELKIELINSSENKKQETKEGELKTYPSSKRTYPFSSSN